MLDKLSQISREWAQLGDWVPVVYVDKAGARLKVIQAAGAEVVKVDAVELVSPTMTALHVRQASTQLGLMADWVRDFKLDKAGYLTAGRVCVVVVDVAGQAGQTQGYKALLPLAVDTAKNEAWPLRGDPLTKRQRWWLKLSRFFTHDRS